MAPPALGDIDRDEGLEIVVGCGNGYQPDSCDRLYVWKANGSLSFSLTLSSRIPGYTSMPYSPVLADYNGDGSVEILMGRLGDWAITVVYPAQRSYETTSHQTDGGLMASPVVDDIDNDGKLETVIGGIDYNYGNERGAIYIWDETGSDTSALPWPMFHRDIRRTGRYPLPPRLNFPSSITVFHQYDTSETEQIVASLRNEGEGSMDWRISHAIPSLRVMPTSGVVVTSAQVRFVITTTNFLTGWHTLGSLTVTATSGEQPVAGSPLVSSLRLFVGDVQRVHLPVVLKSR